MIFVVAAVPGYLLALLKMDDIGHRRLQWLGFMLMGLSFLALGVIPGGRFHEMSVARRAGMLNGGNPA